MQQKIIQIGNSTGVILPKAMLEQLGLRSGSEIEIQEDIQEQSLVITKKGAGKKPSTLNDHFFRVLEKVNTNYGTALKTLAQK
jgi:putative addiction module antidote